MAQSDRPAREPASATENVSNTQSLWRRLFGRANGAPGSPEASTTTTERSSQSDGDPKPGLIHRVSRKVVPGLPRAQTFKRQQSELRNNLEPVQPTPAERRAVSVDRRQPRSQDVSQTRSNPRSSAPDFVGNHSVDHSVNQSFNAAPFLPSVPSLQVSPVEEKLVDGICQLNLPSFDTPQLNHDGGKDDDDPDAGVAYFPDAASMADCQSMTTSQYDAAIHDELERTWILNLSMHFRDKSKREKFFVTYREQPTLWRRVTISVDYRNAPENSLELELAHIKFQRDKIAKIYDAIRESLADIQFYQTVTNLKLQTTEGRLHVHVVEDVNEIIHYPTVRMIQHMRCPRVKERDIEFDSHMSGFVYKVRVNDEILIKKEIPGPDTVDEFLYEINALNRLRHSHHVIRFHGVIVDDNGEYVKGLLISYAERGALIDVIYDQIYPMPWSTRERWARQIISGLSEIHEAGFVQGDFTLSNIVIDDDNNAKIIDINRRGCPVGWEPPEATPLIESNQRISMYIGVKSDLYQLGMVLWAVAMKEDEPEAHGRPLRIGSEVLDVPDWYRSVVDICLSEDPRNRLQALQLLSYFPERVIDSDMDGLYDRPSISVDDGVTRKEYFVDSHPSADGYPQIRTVHPASEWSYVGWSPSYLHSPHDDPYFYPARGRSPPSPMPSNPGEYESSRYEPRTAAWASTYGNGAVAPSESEAAVPDLLPEGKRSVTPRTSRGSVSAPDEMGGLGFNGSMVATGLSAGEEVEESTSAGSPVDGDVTLKVELPSEQSAGTTQHSESAHNFTEEDNIGGMRDFVELGTAQHMHTDLQGPSDTGNTEPEFINNNSKGLVRSYSDATTTQALEPDSSNIPPQPADTVETGERSDTVQGAGVLPASVPLPQKATKSHPRDRMGKTCTEALAPVVEPTPRASSSTSRHSGSSSTLRDLPDDLRGVGSTYDLLSEKRLDSIRDDDLTMFINTDIDRDSKTTAHQ